MESCRILWTCPPRLQIVIQAATSMWCWANCGALSESETNATSTARTSTWVSYYGTDEDSNFVILLGQHQRNPDELKDTSVAIFIRISLPGRGDAREQPSKPSG